MTNIKGRYSAPRLPLDKSVKGIDINKGPAKAKPSAPIGPRPQMIVYKKARYKIRHFLGLLIVESFTLLVKLAAITK